MAHCSVLQQHSWLKTEVRCIMAGLTRPLQSHLLLALRPCPPSSAWVRPTPFQTTINHSQHPHLSECGHRDLSHQPSDTGPAELRIDSGVYRPNRAFSRLTKDLLTFLALPHTLGECEVRPEACSPGIIQYPFSRSRRRKVPRFAVRTCTNPPKLSPQGIGEAWSPELKRGLRAREHYSKPLSALCIGTNGDGYLIL